MSRSTCAVHTVTTDTRLQQDEVWTALQRSCKFKEYNTILERWEPRHLPGSECTNDCSNKVMLHLWQECTIFVLTPAMFRTIPVSAVLRRDYPNGVICDVGQSFRRHIFARQISRFDADDTGPGVQHSSSRLTDEGDMYVPLNELVGKVLQWDGTQAECFGPSGGDLV